MVSTFLWFMWPIGFGGWWLHLSSVLYPFCCVFWVFPYSCTVAVFSYTLVLTLCVKLVIYRDIYRYIPVLDRDARSTEHKIVSVCLSVRVLHVLNWTQRLYVKFIFERSWCSIVSVTTVRASHSGSGKIFLFSALAVGLTQPPVQWVPGICSGGKGAAAWCSLLTAIWCQGQEWVEPYLSCPYMPSSCGSGQIFYSEYRTNFWDKFNFNSRYSNSYNFLGEWLPVKRIGRVQCRNHAATDYGLEDPGILVRFLAGARDFCFCFSPQHPDRLSLLLNSYWALIHRDKAAGVLGWPLPSV
jgi:hypothetical protein